MPVHLIDFIQENKWILRTILLTGAILFGVLLQMLRSGHILRHEALRKSIHILTGMIAAILVLYLDNPLPLFLAGIGFLIFNLRFLYKGPGSPERCYGIVLYPLAFLILLATSWPNDKIIIVAAFLTLTFGDAAAAIAGRLPLRPNHYVLWGDRKSIEGTLAMFVVTTLTIFQVLRYYPSPNIFSEFSLLTRLEIAMIISGTASAAEAFSIKGSDNLSVPISSALLLHYISDHPEHISQLLWGAVWGALAAGLAYRLRMLTASGATIMFLMAVIVFGFGGWQWCIPILTFFVLSSLLSKLGKSIKTQYDLVFEKSSCRDHAQVLANGGLAVGFMLAFGIYQAPQIYTCYLAALAAAAADTWATEIGTLAKQPPRFITTLKRVPPGTSGGITIAGLSSALAGAGSITISGWLAQAAIFPMLDNISLTVIAISGWLGSLVDSLLGATFQAQYRHPLSGQITEKAFGEDGTPNLQISGLSWMNNDMVNFLSILCASLFAYLGIQIFNPNV